MCRLCRVQDDRFISVGVVVVVLIMAVRSVVAYYQTFRQCPKRY